MIRTYISSVLAFSSLLLGCDDGGEPYDYGRIIVLESIDGVRIGDDAPTVIRKLGQPSSIAQGDFPGVRFEYREGEHASMNIVIYEATATPSGVVGFAVWAPYAGKTREGVGIGSMRQDVLESLGQPSGHHISTDSTSWDDYSNVKYRFFLGYFKDRVESIQFSLRA